MMIEGIKQVDQPLLDGHFVDNAASPRITVCERQIKSTHAAIEVDRFNTVFEINFESPPEPGTALLYRAQRFVVTGSADHVRADGTPTKLIIWESHCPDCGGLFEIMTGLKAKSPVRHCVDHRRPTGRRRQG